MPTNPYLDMSCCKTEVAPNPPMTLKQRLEDRQKELHAALAKVNEALALIAGDLDFAAKAQKIEDARLA